MEIEEFSKELKEELKKKEITINSEEQEQLFNYMNMVLKRNEVVNLTAITDPKEFIIKHLVDSATIKKYLENENKIIDIGTGAGFPGIPLKILNSNLKMTLLDSLNKRVDFLNEVIKELRLENIKAIHLRAEEAGQDDGLRENFDVATARAVAPLNILLEYMLPLVKVGGKCICMKGSNIEEEIKESGKALKILGGEIEKIESFTLTDEDNKRNIILIKKVKVTPKKFPRKAGVPKKQPL